MDICVEGTADGQDRQDNLNDEELASVEDLLDSDEELLIYRIFSLKMY